MILQPKYFYVVCEGERTHTGQPKSTTCHDRFGVYVVKEAQEALSIAQASGWGQVEGRDYCPSCYKKMIKQTSIKEK